MDFAIRFDPELGAFDLALEGGGFVLEPSLGTAIALSLFLDARAEPGDLADLGPDQDFRESDPRGWWGGPEYGSRLWLYRRAKLTERTLAGIRSACLEALAWLVDARIARAVDVDIERRGTDAVGICVTVTRRHAAPLRFQYVWNALEGKPLG